MLTSKWMEDSVCLLSASAQIFFCLEQLKRCSQRYHVQSHIYIDLRLSITKDFLFRRRNVQERTLMLCSLLSLSNYHLVRPMSVASASRFKCNFRKMFKFCSLHISIISFWATFRRATLKMGTKYGVCSVLAECVPIFCTKSPQNLISLLKISANIFHNLSSRSPSLKGSSGARCGGGFVCTIYLSNPNLSSFLPNTTAKRTCVT